MIYFLKRPNSDIKIGTTSDYYSRLVSLKKEHGELELLGWFDDDRFRESELHVQFAHLRLGRTEFFSAKDDLLGFIHINRFDYPPPRASKPARIHRLDARIPVTQDTQRLFREFVDGMGSNYDDVLQWMLSRYITSNEDVFWSGRKAAVEFAKYSIEQSD